MQIIKLNDNYMMNADIHYTEQDLENEYNAFLALKIIKKLHELELITEKEKVILTQKIIDQFTPYLSQILSQMT